MSRPTETSVVIVGGSIVGLSSALFLAQRQVPFILLERHTGSAVHPRAIGYTARTVEILRTLGLDKELPVLPPGHGGRPRRVKAETLNGEWTGETQWTKTSGQRGGSKPADAPTGGPPDYSSITPVQGTAIAQDKLEPIIRNKALELGADLRLGSKMTVWSQDENGVSVTATNSAGESLFIRARYMIACDGASSRIRKDLDISTTGVGPMRTLHSILFRCPSIDHHVATGVHQWEIKNDAFEAFMVTYGDGRWALMMYDPKQDTLDEASQKAMVRKAIGDEAADIDLLAEGKWTLSGSVASRFSSGRVFLAGDAAHALPPNRGGYGANTGISDAHNLAWKLAAVLSGKSNAYLLDTYDQERRPIALVRHDQIFARDDYKPYVAGSGWEKTHKPAAIIDDISMELGQIYRSTSVIGSDDTSLPDAQTPAYWKGQPGTRAPHIKLTRNGEEISSLDLFGGGWVILSKAHSWEELTSGSPDVELILVGRNVLEVVGDSFRDAFGVPESGAVLVRPDGYIAARWHKAVSTEEYTSTLKQAAHLS
ncbi:putative FAD binding domain-containing protein [Seiridium cardinale]|uniref:FAD binding domain-containing protein n=1 Tax=Seiridium cardinale TaxID=138064 RepID=A0ABR2XW25_9PEZI